MSINILYIEDDFTNQTVVKGVLSAIGYKNVIIAGSAAKALSIIESPEADIDLILMDLGLPDMNGVELTQKIREGHSKLKDVPIIAITGNDVSSSREKCAKAGMVGFLAKPVDKEQLRVTIEKILS